MEISTSDIFADSLSDGETACGQLGKKIKTKKAEFVFTAFHSLTRSVRNMSRLHSPWLLFRKIGTAVFALYVATKKKEKEKTLHTQKDRKQVFGFSCRVTCLSPRIVKGRHSSSRGASAMCTEDCAATKRWYTAEVKRVGEGVLQMSALNRGVRVF